MPQAQEALRALQLGPTCLQGGFALGAFGLHRVEAGAQVGAFLGGGGDGVLSGGDSGLGLGGELAQAGEFGGVGRDGVEFLLRGEQGVLMGFELGAQALSGLRRLVQGRGGGGAFGVFLGQLGHAGGGLLVTHQGVLQFRAGGVELGEFLVEAREVVLGGAQGAAGARLAGGR